MKSTIHLLFKYLLKKTISSFFNLKPIFLIDPLTRIQQRMSFSSSTSSLSLYVRRNNREKFHKSKKLDQEETFLTAFIRKVVVFLI